ncbi:MAG: DUF1080 domain-containing protein [Phycisphaera sp.]|nr:DUF1080 domain-containing protein [Phycisphaera sp.]
MSRSLSIAFVVLCTALSLSAAEPEVVSAPAEPSGMKMIFNGKDLDGWDGDPRLWSVKDGVIHGETTKENSTNGNTFLIWTAGTTKDFELRASFRCQAPHNSGIQYRSTHDPKPKGNNKWVVRGYQHEIRDQNDLPSVAGFIYEEGCKRGRMALVGDKTVWDADGKKTVEQGVLIDAEGYKKLFKIDDWNDVVIIAKGPHLQHYLNGRLIMDCVDNHPELKRSEGVLAFQIHAGAPMWAEFKDVRFKELD